MTEESPEVMEMWLLTRLLSVSWTDKETDVEILNTANRSTY